MLTSSRALALCALVTLATPAVAQMYPAEPYGGGYAPAPYYDPAPPNHFVTPQLDPIPVPQPAPDLPTTDLSPPPSADIHVIPPNCNLSGCANSYSSDPLDYWR